MTVEMFILSDKNDLSSLANLFHLCTGFERTRKVITFHTAVTKSENAMEFSMWIPGALFPRPGVTLALPDYTVIRKSIGSFNYKGWSLICCLLKCLRPRSRFLICKECA